MAGVAKVMEYLHAPPWRFLARLAEGWSLPFIVEPLQSHHGHYSILLRRAGGE